MRYLVIGFCLLLGCNQPQPQTPVSVSPLSLVRTFRDTPNLANDTWLDRAIVCTIPAGSYTVRDRVVCYQTGKPGTAPCIMFEFDSPVQTAGDITIVGICRGVVRDGLHRGSDVDFCVRVSNCSISR